MNPKEKQIMKSVILNLNFQQYLASCLLDDIPSFCESSFYSKTKPYKNFIINHYNEITQKRIEKLKGESIHIAFDSRWSSRGWAANECTTTIFFKNEQEEYELLSTINLLKKGKDKNYEGTSKNMENTGTNQAIKQIKLNEINISSFVHDGDAGGAAVMKKNYPNSIDYLDIIHKARAIRNRVYKLKDCILRKKIWVQRIVKCASILLYSLKDDLNAKISHVKKKLKHWKGTLNFLEISSKFPLIQTR